MLIKMILVIRDPGTSTAGWCKCGQVESNLYSGLSTCYLSSSSAGCFCRRLRRKPRRPLIQGETLFLEAHRSLVKVGRERSPRMKKKLQQLESKRGWKRASGGG